MENTQGLSSESFSKWVINLKHSFDGLGDSFRASLEASDELAFIEMDPTRAPSWRKSLADAKDFNFATCQSPPFLVHADEVFSDGLLVPFFMAPCEDDTVGATNLAASSESSQFILHAHQARCSFLKRCWKSWRRIVKKHLRLRRRRPASHKVQDSCFSVRAAAVDACMQFDVTASTKWKETSQLTTTTTNYIIHDWSDIEKSIQEAVQHCKRSFEMLPE